MKEKEFNDLVTKIEDRSFNSTNLNINVDVLYEDRTETELSSEQIIFLAAALKKNPTITYLSLYGNKIEDSSAIVLADIATLKELRLSYNDITHIGATALAKCPVEVLDLSENNIYYKEEYNAEFNEMIRAFAQNKTITQLDLSGCKIPSAMIGQLIGKNISIKILQLGGYNEPLNDSVLEFVGKNSVLEELCLLNTEITDKGIEYLDQNKSIKRLYIEESYITDDGVKILSYHPTLKDLSLIGSSITFEAGPKLVAGNLDKLELRSTKHDQLSQSDCNVINEIFFEKRHSAPTILLEEETEEGIEDEPTATKMEVEEEIYHEPETGSIIDEPGGLKVLGANNNMDTSDSFSGER